MVERRRREQGHWWKVPGNILASSDKLSSSGRAQLWPPQVHGKLAASELIPFTTSHIKSRQLCCHLSCYLSKTQKTRTTYRIQRRIFLQEPVRAPGCPIRIASSAKGNCQHGPWGIEGAMEWNWGQRWTPTQLECVSKFSNGENWCYFVKPMLIIHRKLRAWWFR